MAKKKTKREATIAIRVYSDEKELIERAADLEREYVATIGRNLLLEWAKRILDRDDKRED